MRHYLGKLLREIPVANIHSRKNASYWNLKTVVGSDLAWDD